MLDKYFGFSKIQDEESVMESLLEHSRIDEEEILLLSEMVEFLCTNQMDKIQEYYLKIRTISAESEKIFENTADQIIHANFDYRKQYDLLRLYQRIESISGLIIATAKRILILYRIGGNVPSPCHDSMKEFMKGVIAIHDQFKLAIMSYLDNKRKIIEIINKIEEIEHHLDHVRSVSLEVLYKLGNEEKVPLGNLRAIENIIEHLEDIADAIEDAGTSLEWLLLA